MLHQTEGHLILIQDGARYHTSKAMHAFFAQHAERLTVFQLPSYSPDFNPIEYLWRNLKKQATHLRYFPTFAELVDKVEEKLDQAANLPSAILSLMGKYCVLCVFGDGGCPGSIIQNLFLKSYSSYPNDAESWMVYGPFSLAEATAGDLAFQLWLNSELYYNGVCWLASINDYDYYGNCMTGNSSGWTEKELDLTNVYSLGDLMGQPNVWIAIIFTSDHTITYPEGAYVDDTALSKFIAAGGTPAATPPAITPMSWDWLLPTRSITGTPIAILTPGRSSRKNR